MDFITALNKNNPNIIVQLNKTQKRYEIRTQGNIISQIYFNFFDVEDDIFIKLTHSRSMTTNLIFDFNGSNIDEKSLYDFFDKITIIGSNVTPVMEVIIKNLGCEITNISSIKLKDGSNSSYFPLKSISFNDCNIIKTGKITLKDMTMLKIVNNKSDIELNSIEIEDCYIKSEKNIKIDGVINVSNLKFENILNIKIDGVINVSNLKFENILNINDLNWDNISAQTIEFENLSVIIEKIIPIYKEGKFNLTMLKIIECDVGDVMIRNISPIKSAIDIKFIRCNVRNINYTNNVAEKNARKINLEISENTIKINKSEILNLPSVEIYKSDVEGFEDNYATFKIFKELINRGYADGYLIRNKKLYVKTVKTISKKNYMYIGTFNNFPSKKTYVGELSLWRYGSISRINTKSFKFGKELFIEEMFKIPMKNMDLIPISKNIIYISNEYMIEMSEDFNEKVYKKLYDNKIDIYIKDVDDKLKYLIANKHLFEKNNISKDYYISKKEILFQSDEIKKASKTIFLKTFLKEDFLHRPYLISIYSGAKKIIIELIGNSNQITILDYN